MAVNYLITGYHGEPHVTAENDRGINAATFGSGRYVLDVGKKFQAEYIGNNTVRVYDGKLVDGGAVAGIPAGEYIELNIPSCFTGQKRNDLIVFQYEKDASTLIERGSFVVVTGATTTGTPTDPALTKADLLSGTATFDQMPLWRVSVNGTTISAPVKMYAESIFPLTNKPLPVDNGGTGSGSPTIARANLGIGDVATENILPIAKGGTGAITAALARKNLGLVVSDLQCESTVFMEGKPEGLYLVKGAVGGAGDTTLHFAGLFYYKPNDYAGSVHVIWSGSEPFLSGAGAGGSIITYTVSYSVDDDTFYLTKCVNGLITTIDKNVFLRPLF